MAIDTNETKTTRVKGISHYQEAASHCRIGDKVTLVPEPDNPYDRNAVRVDCHQRRIGYIARVLAPSIKTRIGQNSHSAVVSDILGQRSAGFNLGIEIRITFDIKSDSAKGVTKAHERPQWLKDAPLQEQTIQDEPGRKKQQEEQDKHRESLLNWIVYPILCLVGIIILLLILSQIPSRHNPHLRYGNDLTGTSEMSTHQSTVIQHLNEAIKASALQYVSGRKS